MKYPQLVSTRAVNAISDWLVTRLEQLGVEAPQIYTRLLLSLLQSSVQINDPIEFNSLETFIGNRKGGSIRRYLQCDANTLKKLNAVQCLSEIVSSEQELTTIENLVDELWEKLKDIERQLDYTCGNEAILVNKLGNSVETYKTTTEPPSAICENKNLANCNNISKNNHTLQKRTVVGRDINTIELETDPKKRYFNAFPALSKEMEDSFRIWRRNAKSLTWPADRGNIIVSSSSSGINLSTSLDCRVDSTNVKKITDKPHDLSTIKLDHLSNSSNHAVVSSTGGIKRKTKRRKSQPVTKGRPLPNARRAAINDNIINTFSTTGSVGTSRKSNRHMSPGQWDTDFEGYWEMGRDLIKEFFAKQSDKKENRCTSANGAYSVNQKEKDILKMKQDHPPPPVENDVNKELVDVVGTSSRSPPMMMPPVDISFCCDDSLDNDETYKSITELTADNSRSSPRRLYQRLVLPENDCDVEPSKHDDINSDFNQFKAKFNSNIAALWQNTSDDENSNFDELSLWSAPSNIPWPTVAPIKESLKNFWTNFYNHQFDLKNAPPQKLDRKTEQNYPDTSHSDVDANNCASFPYIASTSSSNLPTTTGGTFDFHSMPYNLEGLEKTDGTNENFVKPDGRRTPTGVFFQDSIWSENVNGGKNTDTDESFYLKVWNSNKKLCNMDAIYEKKVNETPKSKQNDTSFQFCPYGASKWSEGINAGPNILFQQHQDRHLTINTSNKNEIYNQQNMISSDCTDASVSTTTSCSSSSHTLSSSGIFSGQTPSMQSSFQANDNTKSLSEVYGIQSPINDDCQNVVLVDNNEQISPISLTNHSLESSGFVEYSRIKSISQAIKLESIQQQQRNYQAQISRPKEQHYPPDDDENLLTSERTHFQPIRAYADGYTFDICSSLEVIDYKRSDSGYLYFESEKYLEYTRKDTFMAEEETNVAAASAAPLYAGSNCDAAISQKRKKERKASEELVLKFRIMNREIACQTDDIAAINRMYAASAQLQHPLYLIFSGAATDGIKIPTTGQACSDAIEALNKAVAAAAKAAAERDSLLMDTPWMRSNELIDSSRNTVGGGGGGGPSFIWNAVQASPIEEIGVDGIDYCNESSCNFENNMNPQWSMREMERRYQLNAGVCHREVLDESSSSIRNSNVDNNNIIGTQQNNADMHSLWGMCAACNSDYKSAPANNLLRDELKLEADQIMSDLKNMQDLYIGCDAAAAGHGENSDVECNTDYFWGRHGNEYEKLSKNINKHSYPIAIHGQRGTGDIEGGNERGEINNWDEGEDLRQKETQQKVLQQVNKLIADLMRPEKGNDTNVLADAAASAHRELGESLWPDDGEHNIWKQQVEPCVEKGNLSASTRSSRNSMLCAEEKQFLAQLTWEHDNLAELWTRSTPPVSSTMAVLPHQQQQSHQKPTTSPPENPPATLCSSPKGSCLKQRRAKSDVRNVQNDINVVSSTKSENGCQSKELSESTANCCVQETSYNDAPNATYKRIQQFLSSTGVAGSVTSTKLKLANRKRRHSASQNFAILHHNNVLSANNNTNQKSSNNSKNNNNNNNNNNKISDLNNYNIKCNADKLPSSGDDIKSYDAAIANFTDDVDMVEQSVDDDSAAYFLIKNGENMILPPAKQTIITCKYWTTIDPMMDTDAIECSEGTTFSCLVDKNDTILKHVTMLARPLTR